jgi:hypothetical protein
MIVHHVRRAIAATAVFACLTQGSLALADSLSKEACIDAHSRGQDAKELGKLSLARKLFQTCSQPSCPAAVQGDCARFADDLSRMQSSLSFSARDGSGSDLPDTSVYVDDVLIVTRLDDGKPHDVDPGKHVVKFQHDTKEQIVTIVVGTGEKGRTVAATFGSPAPAGARLDAPLVRKTPKASHPLGAKVVIGLGAVMVAGGATLGILGMTKIPSNCSLSSHECAAPPGDSSFDDASSAVNLANVGFIVGGVGLAAVIGGAVWYWKGATKPNEEKMLAAPWIGPNGGGIAVMGRL